jgi:hypothetical protein
MSGSTLDDTVLLLTIVAAIVVGLWLLWRPIHGYEARGRHGSVAPGDKDPTADVRVDLGRPYVGSLP